ncbi:Uncharacterised protein [Mycobacterium tuberculosis]|nr:Uncharacterised protein [Mycobacterium tuberculosis]CNM16833.1 Uncharacterised protein [Mycobacterium tuberculosis]CNW23176.1 Uncharacterised protein [Mycobacterium tuberculosis]COU78781.1 Uncharacterised protein [Mycobacterium tuberculosis]COX06556.1 Uncharacterised protein [Mycobacterium tuberculosis]
MPAMAKDVGQVLVQRAAERDVEHLGAATDAQHGHPPLKRAPQ